MIRTKPPMSVANVRHKPWTPCDRQTAPRVTMPYLIESDVSVPSGGIPVSDESLPVRVVQSKSVKCGTRGTHRNDTRPPIFQEIILKYILGDDKRVPTENMRGSRAPHLSPCEKKNVGSAHAKTCLQDLRH